MLSLDFAGEGACYHPVGLAVAVQKPDDMVLVAVRLLRIRLADAEQRNLVLHLAQLLHCELLQLLGPLVVVVHV